MKKKRVLATGSLWSLLIYLLITDFGDIKRTKYFLSRKNIHPSVRKNLNCIVCENFNWDNNPRLMQLYYVIAPLLYRLRYPYLLFSEFFCIDQGFEIQSIVGRNHYTLIEDGLGDYVVREKIKEKGILNYMRRMLYGPMYHNTFGNNRLCKKIIHTMKPTTKVMIEKGELVDLKKLWRESSVDKQNYILSVFNISSYDLEIIQSRKVLLLTQPLSEDKIVSAERKASIYRQIIERFGEHNVIIKTHPRENTNYREIFPNAFVFDKIVPMQLFNILDVKFDTVATLSSSAAVSFMDGKTSIYFEGTEKYPEVAARYGHITLDMILNISLPQKS